MTLILCAMKLEAKPFLKALERLKPEKSASYKAYYGEIAGIKVVVAVCGVGISRTAAAVDALLDSHDISKVIMSGTAGGIDSNLKIGDTIVSEEILFHDKSENLLLSDVPGESGTIFKADEIMLDIARTAIDNNPPDHPVYFGRITTGKKFITSKIRDMIIREFHPLCSDMETAAAAKVCSLKGIPFVAVRSISDSADNSGFMSFLRYSSLASDHSYIVAKRLFKQEIKYPLPSKVI